MIKLKKILRNPWTIGIGTSIISALILKFIDIFAGTNIFGVLLEVAVLVLKYIQTILEFRLSVGGICIICLAVSLLVLFKRRLNREKKNDPLYFAYTEDVFQGIAYRWEYNFIKGRYCIGNTQAYCPACRCRIVHRECQVCKAVFIDMKDEEQIEAMIVYSIEKKFNINEFKELGR